MEEDVKDVERTAPTDEWKRIDAEVAEAFESSVVLTAFT